MITKNNVKRLRIAADAPVTLVAPPAMSNCALQTVDPTTETNDAPIIKSTNVIIISLGFNLAIISNIHAYYLPIAFTATMITTITKNSVRSPYIANAAPVTLLPTPATMVASGLTRDAPMTMATKAIIKLPGETAPFKRSLNMN